jgi:UDPglucose--hexose-1-phosphate uridylyltransferase
MTDEHLSVREDVHAGARVFIVGSRQVRPNLPTRECPFCPGGLEAPEPYDVRWFPNRWPAMPDDRCEVILYTPEHDATFWQLGASGARKVIDLWAARTEALGKRADVAYVLIFENRGETVGATIKHPHGQIYAFEQIPSQPLRELMRGGLLPPVGNRLVSQTPGWRAWVPEAPVFPYAMVLAPDDHVPDLPSLDDHGRNAMSELLVDALERLDGLFDTPTPYMLWIHQRPFDGGDWPQARLHIEIVTPWRATHVPRYIAAGEVGSGVYFNPILPEAAAHSLRVALS